MQVFKFSFEYTPGGQQLLLLGGAAASRKRGRQSS